jgi:hypothetical protein
VPVPLTSGAPVQVQLKTVACQEALVSRAAVGHAHCLCFQHSTKSSAENGQALRQVVVAAVAQPALLPCYSMDETCQVRQVVAADHQEAAVARPHLEEAEAPRLVEAVVHLARAVSPCRQLVRLQAVAEHLQVSGRRSWSADRCHQRYPALAAAMCLAVSYQVVACACFGQLALHPELAAAAAAHPRRHSEGADPSVSSSRRLAAVVLHARSVEAEAEHLRLRLLPGAWQPALHSCLLALPASADASCLPKAVAVAVLNWVRTSVAAAAAHPAWAREEPTRLH